MIWDELTLEEESFEQVLDRRRRKLGGYESLESGLIERDLNHAMDLDGMWNRQTILRAFQEQVHPMSFSPIRPVGRTRKTTNTQP